MEKIKNFFSKIFGKRKENNSIRKKVLFKPKKTFFKKRSYLKLKINIKGPLKFFKKNYIPYYLIFGGISTISIFFIILGPFFRVEKINIIKTDGVTNIDIAYKAVEDFRGISIFKINKNELLEKLKDYQENIKDLSLKINFPKTIEIRLESFKEKYNVNINNKNYLLLENGSLIPTINPNHEIKDLEIIKNIEKTKIIDYKIIFDMQYIKKIEVLEKKVKENIASIKISGLKYYEKERELHIILNDTTRLIFSLDESISIDDQIKSLAVLDREKSQISKNDKIYVDLRIKGKVFICFTEVNGKNNEKQCNQNLEQIYYKL